MRLLQPTLLALVIFACGIGPGRANVFFDWNNGVGSNDWFDADNWEDGIIPERNILVGGSSDEYIARIDAATPDHVIVGIPGAEADDLYLGVGAHGQMTIENGGTLQIDLDSVLARNTGSMATMVVTGSGSNFTTGSLNVGRLGDATLTIEYGGQVTTGPLTFGGGAAGTGTITGVGSKLTTTGTNFYLGDYGTGTVIVKDGGVLDASETGTMWMAWGGTGTLTIESSGTATANDVTMALEKTGVAVTTVSGQASSWTVTGDLKVGSSGSGTVTVTDGGIVSVDGAVTLAERAKYTGNANKQFQSSGTLNIGAARDAAAVAPGWLYTSSIAVGEGKGMVVFNHTADDYQFDPVISGPGTDGTALIEVHAGTTELTGDSSGFGGTTDIFGGTLLVSTGLGGTINVESDGILGGNGTLGDLKVTGGTLAPGMSIGTMEADSVDFDTGSTFAVELGAPGNPGDSDTLVVAGTAALGGATVIVSPWTDFVFDPTAAYEILTAGAIGSEFAGATADFLFLTPSISYEYDSTDRAILTLERNAVSFADLGKTKNQMATAAGAESSGPGSPIYDHIAALMAEEEVRRAYDLLSGEIHPSLKTAVFEDSALIRSTLLNRVSQGFGDVCESATAELETGRWQRPCRNLWMEAFGAWGSTDSDGNAAELDRTIYGALIGVDGNVTDHIRLGFAGGYSTSDVDIDARNASADANTWHVGAYGGLELGRLRLRKGIAYSGYNTDTTRQGLEDAIAADYRADTVQAFGEAGFAFDAMPGTTLEPFGGLAHVWLHTNDFSETGDDAALSVDSNTEAVTFSTLGLRAAVAAGTVAFRGMAGWRHAFGDTTPSTTMHFDGGDAFTIFGVPVAEDAFVAEAGFDATVAPNVRLGLSYSGQIASGTQVHAAEGKFVVGF